MAASTRLRVRLGGNLATLAGFAEKEMLVQGRPPLHEVARQAGITPSLVMVYAVNGIVQPADFTPADGDEVLLVPAVAGG